MAKQFVYISLSFKPHTDEIHFFNKMHDSSDISIYMLHNNGLYVSENKITAPFYVILYFDDLKFFGKTRIWSDIHDKCMNFHKKVFSKSVMPTLLPSFTVNPIQSRNQAHT